MHAIRLVTTLALVVFTGGAFADTRQLPVSFASGVARVDLIELYTSEGCSSCPPADRWLSRLSTNSDLWHRFVPIALHVDYWNDIGWRDRFSRPEYTRRQRNYAAHGHASAVYTPGVFRNGTEWREWIRDRSINPNDETVGNLIVEVDGDTAAVLFDPVIPVEAGLEAHIALLAMDQKTVVTAGENNGRTLHHDFVALNVYTVSLQMRYDGFQAIERIAGIGQQPEVRALAAWVTRQGQLTPLQAVGGYLNQPR